MNLAVCLALLFTLQEGVVESGTVTTRPLRLPKDPDLRVRVEGYRIGEKEFAWEMREIQRTGKIAIFTVAFPSPVQGEIKENNRVRGRLWQPLEVGRRRPGVILLHWLGGNFTALELVGRHLAGKGIPTLMIYLPHYGPRRSADPELREKLIGTDITRTKKNLRQAVLDVRRAGDWMASRPGIDPDRVGIVGISLGAVIGSLVSGIDDRFGRSAFIIGGGDLAGILFEASKETAKIRDSLVAEGWTRESVTAELRDVEPLTFAKRIDRDKILMLNAESDKIIPKACTLKLYEAIGKPEIQWFPGGHYAVALRLAPLLRDITAHLDPPEKEATPE